MTPFIAAYLFPTNTDRPELCVRRVLRGHADFLILTPMPAPTGEVAFKMGDVGRLLSQPKLLLLSLCSSSMWR